tara:strand:+ start:565 stop:924 length:360 start_codon:yes stop_codon:yes gene_type:complete
MTLEIVSQRIEMLEKQMAAVMAKMEEKPKQEKKEKKEKKPKAEKPKAEKKKRGTTGYLVYASEMRPEVKEALIKAGNESPKPTEVITEVAKRWKALSEEEQEVFNEKAKAKNAEASDEE